MQAARLIAAKLLCQTRKIVFQTRTLPDDDMSEPDRKQTKWWLRAALFAANVAMWGVLVARSGWSILWGVPVILMVLLIVGPSLGGWIADRLYPNQTEPDADG
jgi:hypothetical protein